MLRLFRNHSAFNSHNFPRTYTTTYPCSVCRYSLATKPPHHVGPLDSEITPFLPVVLTDWLPSLSTPSALRSLSLPFQLRALHDPLRDYSPPILPLCIQYIQPTCRDCTLHVPRRLWKVADSNRLLIYSIRGPPLNAGEGDAHLFQCRFAPLFPAFSFLMLILPSLLLCHSNRHHLNSFMSS